jgi:hypothetical protein
MIRQWRFLKVKSIARERLHAFTSEESITPGDQLMFDLNVCAPGDVPPPGSAHASYDALVHASHMEVFLNGTPPRFDLVHDGWTVLSKSSEEPVLRDRSDEGATARSPRPWWRFWS